MSNNRSLQNNTYYHVYNRGYNKQTLFFAHKDYARFYRNLKQFLEAYPQINIKCHCILPNHFHFLLIETGLQKSETGLGDGAATDISHFMRKLQVSYSMYFNHEYGDKIKKGLKSPVFEGRFKAKEVLDEAYLAQLVLYIEQNAVKHELVSDIADWPYTSWEPGKTFDVQADFFSDFD